MMMIQLFADVGAILVCVVSSGGLIVPAQLKDGGTGADSSLIISRWTTTSKRCSRTVSFLQHHHLLILSLPVLAVVSLISFHPFFVLDYVEHNKSNPIYF